MQKGWDIFIPVLWSVFFRLLTKMLEQGLSKVQSMYPLDRKLSDRWSTWQELCTSKCTCKFVYASVCLANSRVFVTQSAVKESEGKLCISAGRNKWWRNDRHVRLKGHGALKKQRESNWEKCLSIHICKLLHWVFLNFA